MVGPPRKFSIFLISWVNGVRCVIFVFHHNVQQLKPKIVQHILLDVPSLAFFTTYALLVLFWAEIYYQARAVSTDAFWPTFFVINGIIYAIQIVLWLVIWWKPIPALVILSKMFFAGVSVFAALGFLLYGGRFVARLACSIGSPRVDGDEDEEGFDDLDNEFDLAKRATHLVESVLKMQGKKPMILYKLCGLIYKGKLFCRKLLHPGKTEVLFTEAVKILEDNFIFRS